MIRNRLASLLEDRGIKISRAAMELPNISRNTITNTASNNGKMIQLETIDTLCQYLNITPAEFFEYLPFDLEYHADITENDATTNEFFDYIDLPNNGIKFDFYIKKIVHNGTPSKLYSFTGVIEKRTFLENNEVYLYVKLQSDTNDFKEIWDDPKAAGFKPMIWQNIKKTIANEINRSMMDRFPQMENDPFDYTDDSGSSLLISSDFNTDASYNKHSDDELPF